MSPKSLPRLIAKSDWNGVFQRLQTNPEQAKTPVPIQFEGTVYPLHQSVTVMKKGISVPVDVLRLLIQSHRSALDFNVFIGACENPLFLFQAMEVLYEFSSDELRMEVQRKANDLAILAVRSRSTGVIESLVKTYPFILTTGSLQIAAVKEGTSEILTIILNAGLETDVGSQLGGGGGIFLRQKDNHDSALEVATQLFQEDTESERRLENLVTCVRFANASKMNGTNIKTKPDPKYPIVVAAIGWIPRPLFRKILDIYYEVEETKGQHEWIAQCALHKLLHMAYEEQNNDEIPSIFADKQLIGACKQENPDLVLQILEKDAINTQQENMKFISKSNRQIENALNVAILKFGTENDNVCKVLQHCLKYINAVKMNLPFPQPKYPTILAGISLVPKETLVRISTKLKFEIKTTLTGKAAIKKAILIGLEGGKNAMFADRLDHRHMFPLHINTERMELASHLEPIFEMPDSEKSKRVNL